MSVVEVSESGVFTPRVEFHNDYEWRIGQLYDTDDIVHHAVDALEWDLGRNPSFEHLGREQRHALAKSILADYLESQHTDSQNPAHYLQMRLDEFEALETYSGHDPELIEQNAYAHVASDALHHADLGRYETAA